MLRCPVEPSPMEASTRLTVPLQRTWLSHLTGSWSPSAPLTARRVVMGPYRDKDDDGKYARAWRPSLRFRRSRRAIAFWATVLVVLYITFGIPFFPSLSQTYAEQQQQHDAPRQRGVLRN